MMQKHVSIQQSYCGKVGSILLIANCQLLIALLRYQHSHRHAVKDFSIDEPRIEVKRVVIYRVGINFAQAIGVSFIRK